MLSIFSWLNKSSYQRKLERYLGFKVNHVNTYKEAFTHKSCKENYNNQRLEFLGDSVLNLIISDYLFKKFPTADEGELTKYRVRLVNKQFLKKTALKISLNEWLYANMSDAEKEKSSLMDDALEALIGAIYIDKGLLFCKAFIGKKIIIHLSDEELQEVTDYKSQLVILSQKNKWLLRFNTIISERTREGHYFKIEVLINNHAVSVGHGASKRDAEQDASKKYLLELNQRTIE